MKNFTLEKIYVKLLKFHDVLFLELYFSPVAETRFLRWGGGAHLLFGNKYPAPPNFTTGSNSDFWKKSTV